MRFQTSQAYAVPPVAPGTGLSSGIGSAQNNLNLLSASTVGPVLTNTIQEISGTSALLLEGPETVRILQLIFSWSGVTTIGTFVVPGVTTFYQNDANGIFPLNTQGQEIQVGSAGLVVQNNSTGGNYAVTIFYQEV